MKRCFKKLRSARSSLFVVDEAHCIFYRPEDLGIRRFLAGVGKIDADQVEQVARIIQKSKDPLMLQDLSECTHLSRSKLVEALRRLEDVNVVEILPDGEITHGERFLPLEEITTEVMVAHKSRREFERSRLEMISNYAEVRDCRREFIVNYFGQETDDPCHFCDNCDDGITVFEDEEHVPFPINTCVQHQSWGSGLVLRYEGSKIVVLFDQVGYKTLDIEIILERHLLQRSPKGPGSINSFSLSIEAVQAAFCISRE